MSLHNRCTSKYDILSSFTGHLSKHKRYKSESLTREKPGSYVTNNDIYQSETHQNDQTQNDSVLDDLFFGENNYEQEFDHLLLDLYDEPADLFIKKLHNSI